jgi:hypothetical protein
MLALAASYGVYSFNLLFVPTWVALVSAAAYELTYVGLAVARVSHDQRRRARLISLGAVVVSVLYNTLAGLFHRRPELLSDMHVAADVGLALLHGAPLAWLAFLVADLLLHQEADATQIAAHGNTASEHIASISETPENTPRAAARDRTCRHCGDTGLSASDVMAHGRERAKHGACGSERHKVAAD